MRSAFCLIIFIGLFTACSQIRYFGIETFKPAEVTYPAEVKKILIVDNAVPQPSDSGYDYILHGVVQDTCRAKADSAIYYACRTLGTTIAETEFFQDVLLFHDRTREDDGFLVDTKLTQKQVQALCEETGADAVISFDRLLFSMTKLVSKYEDNVLYGIINVKVTGVVRSYHPSRENPQLSVLVEDSIFWGQDAVRLDILDQLLPKADEALKIAGEYIGEKVHTMFIPHWSREVRWYYTGMGSRWKEASVYATNGKWEEAFAKWDNIYKKTSNWKNKAKLASNIALYYELSGDMENALEWSKTSYDLFKEHAPEEDKSTELQGLYKATILERIRDDKKLNIQFGED